MSISALRNATVSKKVYLIGLVIPLIAILIIATVVYLGINSIGKEANDIKYRFLPSTLQAQEMKFYLVEIQDLFTDSALVKDDASKEINNNAEAFLKNLNLLKETASKENDQRQLSKLEEIKRGFESFIKVGEEMTTAYKNDKANAADSMKKFDEESEAITAELLPLVDEEIKSLHTSLDEEELEISKIQYTVLTIVIVLVVISVFLCAIVAKAITVPVALIKDSSVEIAKGNLTANINYQSKDEIGVVADSLNTTVKSLNSTMQTILNNSQTLAGSSEELISVATQVSANATETSAQAESVSAAAEEVNKSIDSVSAAVEELSASIKEIASHAQGAATASQEAVRSVVTTNETVTRLDESSREIGKVVSLITSIAEQTNLLALNATIEAARAGEAGKGFAVVANEVKELAKQTAKATEEISQKISVIQEDTKSSVSAIQAFNAIIEKINQISSSIAAAVEEQSVTTNEIARNMGEARLGSRDIAQNITGVAQSAENTALQTSETQAAATELAKIAAELNMLVGHFKI